ncbi:MAG: class F sortase [Chloroflexus sp.]
MRLLLIMIVACIGLGACSAATASPPAPPTPLPTTQLASPVAIQTISITSTATPTATAAPTFPYVASATTIATATATVTTTFPANPTPTKLPSITPTAPPPATSQSKGDDTPARLVIPAINLDRKLYPVGLDQNNVPIVLDHEIGWYIYSAKPGQGENIVLWGHVLRFRKAPTIPAPFADLDRLTIGSEILLYSTDGTVFRYVVARQERVTPDQVEYILPTGDERLTLVSCIGDRVIVEGRVELTHRLITIAVPAP